MRTKSVEAALTPRTPSDRSPLARASGTAGITRCWPSRRMVIATSVPARGWMWRWTSSKRVTGWPSNARMRSPGRMPARAAAEDSCTAATAVLAVGRPTVM